MPGTLFVVATPIGNLEDISMRALRVLREAAVIAAEDTRRTAHLLARYAIATPTTSLHEHNEASKIAPLVARLERGDNVALVSDAGTPTISDPGRALVEAALASGIRVEPIPGPNAAVAALAVSGFPADSFTFLGFPPTRSKDRKNWLSRLASIEGIVVFYEAPHRIRPTLQEILATVGDVPVFLGRELTKAHEELVKDHISGALEHIREPRGEFTVVLDIGQKTDIDGLAPPDPTDLLAEFGQLVEFSGLGRRAIISQLSQKHGIPANQVYKMLEAAKK